MKANELMIGDWVQGYLPDTFSIVVGILSEFRLAVVTPGGGYMELPIDDFQPILLTSEILEKNGWHKYYFGTKDISDKVSINYELKNDHTLFLSHCPDEDCFCSAFGMKRIEIRYIHQLQHALRLCGIEKEIVL